MTLQRPLKPPRGREEARLAWSVLGSGSTARKPCLSVETAHWLRSATPHGCTERMALLLRSLHQTTRAWLMARTRSSTSGARLKAAAAKAEAPVEEEPIDQPKPAKRLKHTAAAVKQEGIIKQEPAATPKRRTKAAAGETEHKPVWHVLQSHRQAEAALLTAQHRRRQPPSGAGPARRSRRKTTLPTSCCQMLSSSLRPLRLQVQLREVPTLCSKDKIQSCVRRCSITPQCKRQAEVCGLPCQHGGRHRAGCRQCCFLWCAAGC